MNYIKRRLGAMMFLQYAVWGIWLPVLATYLQSPIADGGLGFTSGQVGWIIGLAGSIGAASAPFIAGQFTDRYFSTEKFLKKSKNSKNYHCLSRHVCRLARLVHCIQRTLHADAFADECYGLCPSG